MRNYILIGGSFCAVLLIAFLGGMQLGQVRMYDSLVFGNTDNMVYIKVASQDQFLIKRYRDNNRIGIIESDAGAEDSLVQLEQQLLRAFDDVQGINTVEIADSELTLFKVENIPWDAILRQVMEILGNRLSNG